MRKAGWAAALVLLAASPAYAIDIPSTAEPSRAHEQLAPALPPPELPEGVEGAKPAPLSVAPEGADQMRFVLNSVVIKGLSVYAEKEVAALTQASIGKEISLADVYALADALTARYRNDGYVLSQVFVPPQTIDGGHVELQAVEGFIDRVVIDSGEAQDKKSLAPYDAILRNSKALKAADLERYMLLLNDLPGVTAKSVLSPAPDTPGASILTLVVERKRVDASVQADNRGSAYMGSMQVSAGAVLNNAYRQQESIGLQLSTTPSGHPHREMNYGRLEVTRPLGHNGTALSVSASLTPTRPGYTLETFGVKGVSRAVGLAVSHPFIRSRDKNLSATARLDYLNSSRTDNLGSPEIEDRLRVLRLSASYQCNDSLHGGVNMLTGEISQGLDLLGMKPHGSANMSRLFGDPEFFKAVASAARIQALTDVFELGISVTGQWAANPLLAPEEFGVGGSAFGSAYDSSEITGRHGVAARAELRANNPFSSDLKFFQPYAFYDIGKTWDPQAAAAGDRIRSLASAGMGFRVDVNDNISASCELALPLTRDVAAVQNQDPRAFMSLSFKF